MKTLELKDLKYYLGTGLKVKIGEKTRDLTAVSLDSPFIFVTIYEGSRQKEMQNICNAKPILLPLSALVEQLPDGSIPIVVLAGMAYKWQKWDKRRINKTNSVLEGSPYDFWFSEETKDFMLCTGSGYLHINNQLQLFEYLYQNHFWLGNQSLFETGEIIDKRTLK